MNVICRLLCTGIKRQMLVDMSRLPSSWLAVSAARDVGCFGGYCAEVKQRIVCL